MSYTWFSCHAHSVPDPHGGHQNYSWSVSLQNKQMFYKLSVQTKKGPFQKRNSCFIPVIKPGKIHRYGHFNFTKLTQQTKPVLLCSGIKPACPAWWINIIVFCTAFCCVWLKKIKSLLIQHPSVSFVLLFQIQIQTVVPAWKCLIASLLPFCPFTKSNYFFCNVLSQNREM